VIYSTNSGNSEIESFNSFKIPETDETEVIRIVLKHKPNLTATRTQKQFHKDDKKHTLTEELSISVQNGYYYPITTIVEDCLFRWKNWKITQTSSEFHPNGKDKARWVLTIPPNGTEVITYTVQYSWEQ